MERISREKLIEITQYKQPSKQVQWLQQRGIPFYLDRYAHPVVFDDALLGNKTKSPQKVTAKWQPPILT